MERFTEPSNIAKSDICVSGLADKCTDSASVSWLSFAVDSESGEPRSAAGNLKAASSNGRRQESSGLGAVRRAATYLRLGANVTGIGGLLLPSKEPSSSESADSATRQGAGAAERQGLQAVAGAAP